MKQNKYEQFSKEIKLLVMGNGRSSLLSIAEVEELIVKYDINLTQLAEVEIE